MNEAIYDFTVLASVFGAERSPKGLVKLVSRKAFKQRFPEAEVDVTHGRILLEPQDSDSEVLFYRPQL